MMAEVEMTEIKQNADVALDAAKAMFSLEGLVFPPVNAADANRLNQLTPTLFSTREIEASPRSIEIYVAEALQGTEPEPYTILGYVPGGVMGSAMHFYSVDSRLALFVQFSWGGPFDDAEQGRAFAERVFGWAASLPGKLDTARASGKLPADQRLSVVLTDFGPPGWGFVKPGTETNAETALNRTGPVMRMIDAAIDDLLAGRTA